MPRSRLILVLTLASLPVFLICLAAAAGMLAGWPLVVLGLVCAALPPAVGGALAGAGSAGAVDLLRRQAKALKERRFSGFPAAAEAAEGSLGLVAADLAAAAADLKERLGMASGVLTGLTQPCLVVDTQERLTFINQIYLDLYDRGGKPEDYLGQTLGRFFYGDPDKKTITGKAMAQHEALRDLEMETTTKAGKDIYVRYDVCPLYDLEGELIGAFAMLYDLTEFRKNVRLIEAKNEAIEAASVKVGEVSDEVHGESERLSALVARAEEGAQSQKQRATETATAMEEMNATVLEVARSAAQAAELADRSRDRAQHGADIVARAVTTIREVHDHAESLRGNMAELGSQAEGISEIMNVIREIADQTNLLALNAAIEAARAGDAGRGFAVVADEVRKLAEKTMNATKDVAASIEAIQESARLSVQSTEGATAKIDESTEMADQSGEALKEIVSLVDQTADQVRSIATASEEQSAASEEINRGASDIMATAEDTSRAMADARQAVGELVDVAGELSATVAAMRGGA